MIEDCKIHVGVENTREFQEKLFSAGLIWCTGDTDCKSAAEHIYITDNCLTQTARTDQDYFEINSRKELTVDEVLDKLGIKSNDTQKETPMKNVEFKTGDKVRLANCTKEDLDAFSCHKDMVVGATYTVSIRHTDSENLFLRGFDQQHCVKVEWLEIVEKKSTAKPRYKQRKAVIQKCPESALREVHRMEVLYTDGTSYNVGGIIDFSQCTNDKDGDTCVEYTKRVNDDVEGTFRIKKNDLAAMVLRYKSGLTEILQYSNDVVVEPTIRLKKKVVKTPKEAPAPYTVGDLIRDQMEKVSSVRVEDWAAEAAIQPGSRVEVIDTGKGYSTYPEFYHKYGMGRRLLYVYGESVKRGNYTVVALAPHSHAEPHQTVVIVTNGKQDWMIEIGGLKLIK